MSGLGLTANECETYLTLLEFGPMSLADIARRTGVHRSLLYQAVPRLLEQKLVAETRKGKRKIYLAESPERIRALVSEFAARAERLLPQFSARHRMQSKRPLVKILEGRKGMMSALENVVTSLKKHDVYYRYSSRKQTTDFERYLTPTYRKARDEKELERFVITSPELGKSKKQRLGRAVKMIPASTGLFDQNIAFILYGESVVYVDYNTETALVIENQKIADFHKKLFKLLYERL